ncbi:MAG: hypothetical protein HY867_17725 [Chloroflexi bacterium]|nr:hypothetical protein [Chloroflexota bacterium]
MANGFLADKRIESHPSAYPLCEAIRWSLIIFLIHRREMLHQKAVDEDVTITGMAEAFREE